MSRVTKTQLTIRGFDERLDRRIREVARENGISRNQAALRLLRRGAGLDEVGGNPRAIGTALDDLIGTWSERDARELDEAVKDFEVIDEALWR
jgi:transposase-like protein